MGDENTQTKDIRTLLYKLRWETEWYTSPVTNEGTPFDGGFASRPPDRVTITFEPAIKTLHELKTLISQQKTEVKQGVDALIKQLPRLRLAEELLRARQQYRGENVDDYLTSPEFFQITHDRKLLWSYEEGFERGKVVRGREYLEKIDELVTLLVGEEYLNAINPTKGQETNRE